MKTKDKTKLGLGLLMTFVFIFGLFGPTRTWMPKHFQPSQEPRTQLSNESNANQIVLHWQIEETVKPTQSLSYFDLRL
jgi:hypothetical protein